MTAAPCGPHGTATGVDRLLAEIAEAPAGPATGVYVDFDGTLIRGHSALAFCLNRIRHGEWPAEAWRALTSASPARIAAGQLYVDASTEDIERWYLSRFRKLRRTAFQNPSSY
ncbi:hypothetical protein ACWCQV_36755, partial [Streptomyces eurythermus]